MLKSLVLWLVECTHPTASAVLYLAKSKVQHSVAWQCTLIFNIVGSDIYCADKIFPEKCYRMFVVIFFSGGYAYCQHFED